MEARKIVAVAGGVSVLAGLGRMIAGAALPLQTVAVITIISIGVGGIVAVANSEDKSGALKPLGLSGRIADEWRDVFDITDQPASFVRELRSGAELYGSEYRVGARIIDLAVVRADALEPCTRLTRKDGSTPDRWARSLCPMRISLVSGPGAARQIRATACLPPQLARGDKTTARLDRQRGIIEVDTTVDGAIEAACHRTVHIGVEAVSRIIR